MSANEIQTNASRLAPVVNMEKKGLFSMFFWEKSFQDSLLNEAVAYKTSPWVAINRHQNPLCDNGIGCWYTAFALDIQRIAEASLPKNSKNFADNVNVSEQLGF